MLQFPRITLFTRWHGMLLRHISCLLDMFGLEKSDVHYGDITCLSDNHDKVEYCV